MFVKVRCPKCGGEYTSLPENAKMIESKGCVLCTMGTENEWEPIIKAIMILKKKEAEG